MLIPLSEDKNAMLATYDGHSSPFAFDDFLIPSLTPLVKKYRNTTMRLAIRLISGGTAALGRKSTYHWTQHAVHSLSVCARDSLGRSSGQTYSEIVVGLLSRIESTRRTGDMASHPADVLLPRWARCTG